MEAGFGGRFQYGGRFRRQFEYGGRFRRQFSIRRQIPGVDLLLEADLLGVYKRDVGGVSFNMEADVRGSFTYGGRFRR
jgi:hypothetical protein